MQAAEYDAMTHCSIGCKNTFLGDRNCDEECYNEACEFDGGDCEDQCAPPPLLHHPAYIVPVSPD
jgi:hypothetical protein